MITSTFASRSASLGDFAALASPWARSRLRLRSRCRQMAWRWFHRRSDATKRALDIVGSAAALVALAPLFLVVALLIKVDGGPVFFMQTRVGRHGRTFRMFKFRSMCRNAEQKLRELLAHNQHATGVTFKIKDDPRITRVGRWLRKYSVDEFPQFYNVLRGDMSLVGPRPLLPEYLGRYSAEQARRHEVRPGITGLAQVSGRNALPWAERLALDVRYVDERSLGLDAVILLRTVGCLLSRRGISAAGHVTMPAFAGETLGEKGRERCGIS